MRRPRYPGKNPRAFHLKYKELQPERYAADVQKVLQAGKTPAGMHRPIMVNELLAVLTPQPGELAVDCTLGFGGHARAVLERLRPGGRLIGLDVDPLELPRSEARLRKAGLGADVFDTRRTNFAGLAQVLGEVAPAGADLIYADLGVSSMQLDNPERGFTFKDDAPLDMRMNPTRGEPASALLARLSVAALTGILVANADEPLAEAIAQRVAGQQHDTTRALAHAVRVAVMAARPRAPHGRVAILTFHSGEDRRVKKAFQAGRRESVYVDADDDVVRASAEEVRANPRASSAKLRWAVRTPRATIGSSDHQPT